MKEQIKTGKYCLLIRQIALFTALSVCLSSYYPYLIPDAHANSAESRTVSYARDGNDQARNELFRESSIASAREGGFSLPPELGSVKEKYQGNRKEFVVLIQDAHAVPEAQHSLRGLIEYFASQYHLQTVALEGLEGRLDATFFRAFPNKELLRNVLESYIQQGELSGPVLASIFSEPSIRFEGLEEQKLYEKGISAYRNALEAQSELLAELQSLQSELQREKRKHYSKHGLEVDDLLREWREERVELPALLQSLQAYLKPTNHSYPNLTDFLRVARHDEFFNSADLRTKIGQLIKKIPQHYRPEVSAWAQLWETEQISGGEFLYQISSRLPELHMNEAWAQRLSAYQIIEEMKAGAFLDELNRYLEQLQQSLITSPKAKAIYETSIRYDLLTKLVQLELTQQEWRRIDQIMRSHQFKIENPKLNLFREFYETTKARDQIFIQKIEKLLSEPLMIVSGGFHEETLTEHFRREGISYLVVTPSFQGDLKQENYHRQMRGDVSWKDYFEVKNERVNVYEAFHRAARDRLLEPSHATHGYMLKNWRDSIIRLLAQEGRIEEAADYTRFLDEVAGLGGGVNFNSLKVEWLQRLDQFAQGLRLLEKNHELSESSIANLMTHTTLHPGAVQPLQKNSLQPAWWFYPDLEPRVSQALSETRTIETIFETKIERKAEVFPGLPKLPIVLDVVARRIEGWGIRQKWIESLQMYGTDDYARSDGEEGAVLDISFMWQGQRKGYVRANWVGNEFDELEISLDSLELRDLGIMKEIWTNEIKPKILNKPGMTAEGELFNGPSMKWIASVIMETDENEGHPLKQLIARDLNDYERLASKVDDVNYLHDHSSDWRQKYEEYKEVAYRFSHNLARYIHEFQVKLPEEGMAETPIGKILTYGGLEKLEVFARRINADRPDEAPLYSLYMKGAMPTAASETRSGGDIQIQVMKTGGGLLRKSDDAETNITVVRYPNNLRQKIPRAPIIFKDRDLLVLANAIGDVILDKLGFSYTVKDSESPTIVISHSPQNIVIDVSDKESIKTGLAQVLRTASAQSETRATQEEEPDALYQKRKKMGVRDVWERIPIGTAKDLDQLRSAIFDQMSYEEAEMRVDAVGVTSDVQNIAPQTRYRKLDWIYLEPGEEVERINSYLSYLAKDYQGFEFELYRIRYSVPEIKTGHWMFVAVPNQVDLESSEAPDERPLFQGDPQTDPGNVALLSETRTFRRPAKIFEEERGGIQTSQDLLGLSDVWRVDRSRLSEKKGFAFRRTPFLKPREMAELREMRDIVHRTTRGIIRRDDELAAPGIYKEGYANVGRVVGTLKELGVSKAGWRNPHDRIKLFRDWGFGKADLSLAVAVLTDLNVDGAEWDPYFYRFGEAARISLEEYQDPMLRPNQVSFYQGDFNDLDWDEVDFLYYYSFGAPEQSIDFETIIEEAPSGMRLLLLGDGDAPGDEPQHETVDYEDFTPLLESGKFTLERFPQFGVWVFTRKMRRLTEDFDRLLRKTEEKKKRIKPRSETRNRDDADLEAFLVNQRFDIRDLQNSSPVGNAVNLADLRDILVEFAMVPDEADLVTGMGWARDSRDVQLGHRNRTINWATINRENVVSRIRGLTAILRKEYGEAGLFDLYYIEFTATREPRTGTMLVAVHNPLRGEPDKLPPTETPVFDLDPVSDLGSRFSQELETSAFSETRTPTYQLFDEMDEDTFVWMLPTENLDSASRAPFSFKELTDAWSRWVLQGGIIDGLSDQFIEDDAIQLEFEKDVVEIVAGSSIENEADFHVKIESHDSSRNRNVKLLYTFKQVIDTAATSQDKRKGGVRIQLHAEIEESGAPVLEFTGETFVKGFHRAVYDLIHFRRGTFSLVFKADDGAPIVISGAGSDNPSAVLPARDWFRQHHIRYDHRLELHRHRSEIRQRKRLFDNKHWVLLHQLHQDHDHKRISEFRVKFGEKEGVVRGVFWSPPERVSDDRFHISFKNLNEEVTSPWIIEYLTSHRYRMTIDANVNEDAFIYVPNESKASSETRIRASDSLFLHDGSADYAIPPRAELGSLQERVNKRLDTYTYEISQPRPTDPRSFEIFARQMAEAYELYRDGIIDGVTLLDDHGLTLNMEAMVKAMRGVSLPDGASLPRWMRNGLRKVGKAIEASDQKWARTLRSIWYEATVFQDITVAEAPPSFIATVGAQLRSSADIEERIIKLVERGAKALFFVGGGHVGRKIAREIGVVKTTEMIRIAKELKEAGRIPKEVQIWASWDPYQEPVDENGDADIQNKKALQKLRDKKNAGAEVIITQPPLLQDRWMSWFKEAHRQGLTQDMQFKVGAPVLYNARNVRFWMGLLNIDAEKEPEAIKLLDDWRRAEDEGRLEHFIIQRNVNMLRWIDQLPVVTGWHLQSTSEGWPYVSTILRRLKISKKRRFTNDRHSNVRHEHISPFVHGLYNLPKPIRLSYARELQKNAKPRRDSERTYAEETTPLLPVIQKVFERLQKEHLEKGRHPELEGFFDNLRLYLHRIGFTKDVTRLNYESFNDPISLRPFDSGHKEIAIDIRHFAWYFEKDLDYGGMSEDEQVKWQYFISSLEENPALSDAERDEIASRILSGEGWGLEDNLRLLEKSLEHAIFIFAKHGKQNPDSVDLDAKPVLYEETVSHKFSAMIWTNFDKFTEHVTGLKKESIDLFDGFVEQNASQMLSKLLTTDIQDPVHLELSVAEPHRETDGNQPGAFKEDPVLRAKAMILKLQEIARQANVVENVRKRGFRYVFADISVQAINDVKEYIESLAESPHASDQEFLNAIKELNIKFSYEHDLNAADLKERLKKYEDRMLVAHTTNLYEVLWQNFIAKYYGKLHLVLTQAHIRRESVERLAGKYGIEADQLAREMSAISSSPDGVEKFFYIRREAMEESQFYNFWIDLVHATTHRDSYEVWEEKKDAEDLTARNQELLAEVQPYLGSSATIEILEESVRDLALSAETSPRPEDIAGHLLRTFRGNLPVDVFLELRANLAEKLQGFWTKQWTRTNYVPPKIEGVEDPEQMIRDSVNAFPGNIWVSDSKYAMQSMSQVLSLMHLKGTLQMTQFSAFMDRIRQSYEGMRTLAGTVVTPLNLDLVEEFAYRQGYGIRVVPFSKYGGKIPTIQSVEVDASPPYLQNNSGLHEKYAALLGGGLGRGFEKLRNGKKKRLVIGRGMGYWAPETFWGRMIPRKTAYVGGLIHETHDLVQEEDEDGRRHPIEEGTEIPALIEKEGTVHWIYPDNMQQTVLMTHNVIDEINGTTYQLFSIYTHLKLDPNLKAGDKVLPGQVLGTIERSQSYPNSPVTPHLHFAVGLIEKELLDRFFPNTYRKRNLYPRINEWARQGRILYLDYLQLVSPEVRDKYFVVGDEAKAGIDRLVLIEPDDKKRQQLRGEIGRQFPGIELFIAKTPEGARNKINGDPDALNIVIKPGIEDSVNLAIQYGNDEEHSQDYPCSKTGCFDEIRDFELHSRAMAASETRMDRGEITEKETLTVTMAMARILSKLPENAAAALFASKSAPNNQSLRREFEVLDRRVWDALELLIKKKKISFLESQRDFFRGKLGDKWGRWSHYKKKRILRYLGAMDRAIARDHLYPEARQEAGREYFFHLDLGQWISLQDSEAFSQELPLHIQLIDFELKQRVSVPIVRVYSARKLLLNYRNAWLHHDSRYLTSTGELDTDAVEEDIREFRRQGPSSRAFKLKIHQRIVIFDPELGQELVVQLKRVEGKRAVFAINREELKERGAEIYMGRTRLWPYLNDLDDLPRNRPLEEHKPKIALSETRMLHDRPAIQDAVRNGQWIVNRFGQVIKEKSLVEMHWFAIERTLTSLHAGLKAFPEDVENILDAEIRFFVRQILSLKFPLDENREANFDVLRDITLMLNFSRMLREVSGDWTGTHFTVDDQESLQQLIQKWPQLAGTELTLRENSYGGPKQRGTYSITFNLEAGEVRKAKFWTVDETVEKFEVEPRLFQRGEIDFQSVQFLIDAFVELGYKQALVNPYPIQSTQLIEQALVRWDRKDITYRKQPNNGLIIDLSGAMSSASSETRADKTAADTKEMVQILRDFREKDDVSISVHITRADQSVRIVHLSNVSALGDAGNELRPMKGPFEWSYVPAKKYSGNNDRINIGKVGAPKKSRASFDLEKEIAELTGRIQGLNAARVYEYESQLKKRIPQPFNQQRVIEGAYRRSFDFLAESARAASNSDQKVTAINLLVHGAVQFKVESNITYLRSVDAEVNAIAEEVEGSRLEAVAIEAAGKLRAQFSSVFPEEVVVPKKKTAAKRKVAKKKAAKKKKAARRKNLTSSVSGKVSIPASSSGLKLLTAAEKTGIQKVNWASKGKRKQKLRAVKQAVALLQEKNNQKYIPDFLVADALGIKVVRLSRFLTATVQQPAMDFDIIPNAIRTPEMLTRILTSVAADMRAEDSPHEVLLFRDFEAYTGRVGSSFYLSVRKLLSLEESATLYLAREYGFFTLYDSDETHSIREEWARKHLEDQGLVVTEEALEAAMKIKKRAEVLQKKGPSAAEVSAYYDKYLSDHDQQKPTLREIAVHFNVSRPKMRNTLDAIEAKTGKKFPTRSAAPLDENTLRNLRRIQGEARSQMTSQSLEFMDTLDTLLLAIEKEDFLGRKSFAQDLRKIFRGALAAVGHYRGPHDEPTREKARKLRTRISALALNKKDVQKSETRNLQGDDGQSLDELTKDRSISQRSAAFFKRKGITGWHFAALIMVMIQGLTFVIAKHVLELQAINPMGYLTTLFLWSNVWSFGILIYQSIKQKYRGEKVNWRPWYWTMTEDEIKTIQSLPPLTRWFLVPLNALFSQFTMALFFVLTMQTHILPYVVSTILTGSLPFTIFTGILVFGSWLKLKDDKLNRNIFISLAIVLVGMAIILADIGMRESAGNITSFTSAIAAGFRGEGVIYSIILASVGVIQSINQKFIVDVQNPEKEHLPSALTKYGYRFGFPAWMGVSALGAFGVLPQFLAPVNEYSQALYANGPLGFFVPSLLIPLLSLIFTLSWWATYTLFRKIRSFSQFTFIRGTQPFWTFLGTTVDPHFSSTWNQFISSSISGVTVLIAAWVASIKPNGNGKRRARSEVRDVASDFKAVTPAPYQMPQNVKGKASDYDLVLNTVIGLSDELDQASRVASSEVRRLGVAPFIMNLFDRFQNGFQPTALAANSAPLPPSSYLHRFNKLAETDQSIEDFNGLAGQTFQNELSQLAKQIRSGDINRTATILRLTPKLISEKLDELIAYVQTIQNNFSRKEDYQIHFVSVGEDKTAVERFRKALSKTAHFQGIQFHSVDGIRITWKSLAMTLEQKVMTHDRFKDHFGAYYMPEEFYENVSDRTRHVFSEVPAEDGFVLIPSITGYFSKTTMVSGQTLKESLPEGLSDAVSWDLESGVQILTRLYHVFFEASKRFAASA